MPLLPVLDDELAHFSAELDGVLGEAMTDVRDDQLRPHGIIEVKADLSLVLATDKKVERRLQGWAAKLGLPFHGEEFGARQGHSRRYKLVADPVDGSRPLANRDMGGSTIIMYLYDMVERRIVATIIARPGTGEVWVAANGETNRYLYSYETGTFHPLNRCNVWEFDAQVSRPTVYVDNPNPFTRRGVDMLRADGLDRMDASFRDMGYTKFAIGSNGLHHCLVATGGPVVGSITTSIGGVQDLGGIKVVEDAGGLVAAYWLNRDRSLIQVDPHRDIFMNGGEGYDYLVTAIDDARMIDLKTALARAL